MFLRLIYRTRNDARVLSSESVSKGHFERLCVLIGGEPCPTAHENSYQSVTGPTTICWFLSAGNSTGALRWRMWRLPGLLRSSSRLKRHSLRRERFCLGFPI